MMTLGTFPARWQCELERSPVRDRQYKATTFRRSSDVRVRLVRDWPENSRPRGLRVEIQQEIRRHGRRREEVGLPAGNPSPYVFASTRFIDSARCDRREGCRLHRNLPDRRSHRAQRAQIAPVLLQSGLAVQGHQTV